jgi:hypothetical protein
VLDRGPHRMREGMSQSYLRQLSCSAVPKVQVSRE